MYLNVLHIEFIVYLPENNVNNVHVFFKERFKNFNLTTKVRKQGTYILDMEN